MDTIWTERMNRNLAALGDSLIDILEKKNIFDETVKQNIEDIIMITKEKTLFETVKMLHDTYPADDTIAELYHRIGIDTATVLEKIVSQRKREEDSDDK